MANAYKNAAVLRNSVESVPKPGFFTRLLKDLRLNYCAYMMVIPVLAYYLIFHYGPMYGALIAFKDYVPRLGIFGSPWAGFKHFVEFFSSYSFWKILRNTVVMSMASIVFGFPIPIIFALLLNELKHNLFKRTIQTITYIPHFISLVVICGLIKNFSLPLGILSRLVAIFAEEGQNLLAVPGYFVPIYVISGIWQEFGWNSIIYIAAISAIDQSLYESAVIDGAGRWRQIWNITLPGIMPTIIVLFVLRMGSLMSVGFEKIILLYQPLVYDTADVISTYVYRKGLLEFNYSYSAAVGLFNSVINCLLLVLANRLTRKTQGYSLW